MSAFEEWATDYLQKAREVGLPAKWTSHDVKEAFRAGMLAAAEIANSQDAPNNALKIRDAIRKVAEETTD